MPTFGAFQSHVLSRSFFCHSVGILAQFLERYGSWMITCLVNGVFLSSIAYKASRMSSGKQNDQLYYKLSGLGWLKKWVKEIKNTKISKSKSYIVVIYSPVGVCIVAIVMDLG